MAIFRRRVILSAAGGLALVGAGAWWRVSRVPHSATRPWDLSGPPPGDVRLDAFRHAILAPNPHNLQPWLIRLDGDKSATVFCDLDQRLPETDPFDRQITIGFGCFLELARMAARARGVEMAIAPFPEGEPPGNREGRLDSRPVARLTFTAAEGLAPDPLFPHIPARRSNKEAYDLARSVSREELRAFSTGDPSLPSRVRATGRPESVRRIREIVLQALDIEMTTPRAHGETVRLVRIGARAVDAQPDGIALTGPLIEAASAAGMISAQTLADPTSWAFAQGRTMMRESHGSAPAFVWITTSRNDRRSQLDAGRAHVRANLMATAMGLSMHPASQALQEYPQMAEPFRRIHELLSPEGGRIQMLSRVGYGPEVAPSPRFPLDARLIA